VHLLPAVFTVGCALLVLLALIGLLVGNLTLTWLSLLPILAYALLLFIDASRQNKSLKIGLFEHWCIIYPTDRLRLWISDCIVSPLHLEERRI